MIASKTKINLIHSSNILEITEKCIQGMELKTTYLKTSTLMMRTFILKSHISDFSVELKVALDLSPLAKYFFAKL